AARYLSGGGGENLPSPLQGAGMLDLGRAFDGVSRLLVDQDHVLQSTGEVITLRGQVINPGQPLRISLAWSDAPGATVADSYVNNLDLEVEVGGQLYLGNVFAGAVSVSGGMADPRNNLEQVFLPAGQQGQVVIRIRAANLAGDGAPGSPDPTDQDFALVGYNLAEQSGRLRGRVVDQAGGLGLPGALLAAQGSGRSFQSVVDAGGVYTLPLPTGVYTVSAWKYGYSLAVAPDLEIAADQDTLHDFSLQRAAEHNLSGCIRDQAGGEGLAADLTVYGPLGGVISSTQVTQDSPCYMLRLAAGGYRLQVESLLHNPGEAQVALTGDLVQDFALSATTTDGMLVGQVSAGLSGAGLPGARLSLPPDSTAYAGEQGQYRLQLPPGVYTVTADYPLHQPQTQRDLAVPQSRLAHSDFTLAAARLALSPAQAISRTLQAGQVYSTVVWLENTGSAPLAYWAYEAPAGGAAADPGGYAYQVLDSRVDPGVSFQWTDALTETLLALSDDGEANLELPFPFTLYGKTAQVVRVSNNGALLLGVESGDVSYNNLSLGSTALEYLVAPLWDDLDASAGWVAYRVLGQAPQRRLVVQWSGRPHYSAIGAVTFQAILYEGTNNIKFQYKDVDFGSALWDAGASATVGLRGYNGYLDAFSYQQAALQDGLALCFQAAGAPPCDPLDLGWLKLASASGVLAPGAGAPLTVTLDSRALPGGLGRARVRIASSDPARQPAWDIPVQLRLPVLSYYLPLVVNPYARQYFPLVRR
ncbi:MAG: carboxypeptidase-like regulatory domain-containing protein, partial [Chloroflexota bacterium]